MHLYKSVNFWRLIKNIEIKIPQCEVSNFYKKLKQILNGAFNSSVAISFNRYNKVAF